MDIDNELKKVVDTATAPAVVKCRSESDANTVNRYADSIGKDVEGKCVPGMEVRAVWRTRGDS